MHLRTNLVNNLEHLVSAYIEPRLDKQPPAHCARHRFVLTVQLEVV